LVLPVEQQVPLNLSTAYAWLLSYYLSSAQEYLLSTYCVAALNVPGYGLWRSETSLAPDKKLETQSEK
jgi:hypothetical protein